MNKSIKISKLDAAKRQLEIAIRLYFNEADPVSIHTLAGAAHVILSDLNVKYGGQPMIISDCLISDEYKNEFRWKIKEAMNHFKHADKKPDSVLDFNPDVNENYIYDACVKYEELTSENVPYFKIFKVWFASGHPEAFNFEGRAAYYAEIKQRYKNKYEYFSAMLAVSGALQ